MDDEGEESLQTARLTPQEAGDAMEGLLEAVAEAHDRGVLLRDLKLGNVLISRPGGRIRVRLIDPDFCVRAEGAGGVLSRRVRRPWGTPAFYRAGNLQRQDFRGLHRHGPLFRRRVACSA